MNIYEFTEEALEYSKLLDQTYTILDESTMVSRDIRTTLMLRNIPNKFTRDELVEVISLRMSLDNFDFFYLPSDFRSGCNFGYAFINLRSPARVAQFFEQFHLLPLRKRGPAKTCQVGYGRIQGLQENIARLVNSPIMGASEIIQTELDSAMPILFDVNGNVLPFPKPHPLDLPQIMNPRASASLANPPHKKPTGSNWKKTPVPTLYQ